MGRLQHMGHFTTKFRHSTKHPTIEIQFYHTKNSTSILSFVSHRFDLAETE